MSYPAWVAAKIENALAIPDEGGSLIGISLTPKAWRTVLEALKGCSGPLDEEVVEQINQLCDHQIPFYAYGDNQAAVEMANRLEQIAHALPTATLGEEKP